MKVAAIQMTSTPGETARNVERGAELIGQAASRGARLAVLPEFFNTEYFAQYRDEQYFALAEPLDGPSISAIKEVARDHDIWVIASVYERFRSGIYFDSSVVISPGGETTGVYRKTHPAAVFSLEKLYFRYGSEFPVFQIDDWPIGISICYDNLFPEAVRALVLRGAEMIICPFASHPDNPVWRELHRVRAFENGSYVVVANKVGLEGGWTFGGQSMIVHPSGEILALGAQDADDVIVSEISREEVGAWRRRYPMLRDRRPDLYAPLVVAQERL